MRKEKWSSRLRPGHQATLQQSDPFSFPNELLRNCLEYHLNECSQEITLVRKWRAHWSKATIVFGFCVRRRIHKIVAIGAISSEIVHCSILSVKFLNLVENCAVCYSKLP